MVDPDPVDRAYSQAESLLNEEAERAARRARVLAAIAQDDVVHPTPQKSMSRFTTRGGWLVAASVLVASGFLVARFLPLREPPPTAQAPVPKNQMTAALSPPARVTDQPEAASSTPAAKAPDRAARAAAESSREALAAPPPAMAASPPPAASVPTIDAPPRAFPMVPTPPPMAAPPPPAPPAFARAAPPPPAAPAPMADMAKSMGEAEGNLAFDQLRAAAAAGRASEVQALLDRRIAVDTADADGETALMKSIRAHQPTTASLLIRHGASLDKKNNAGLSARDLAAQINDPALNHALGLER
jgi:hypothetical protein